MSKLLNHRISFNCDLFMTVQAPADADTKALEQLAIEAIRELFDDGDTITAIPLPVGRTDAREDVEYDMTVYVRRVVTPGTTESDPDDADTELENFTIENVDDPEGDSLRAQISGLTRAQIVAALENVSIQCNDDEPTETLAEALAVNIEDETIDISEVPGLDA